MICLTKKFLKCNHVIANRSTFIYSALQASKNLYIYKKYNYDWDEISLNNSKTFLNLNELIDAINITMDNNVSYKDIPRFFNKLDPDMFLNVLDTK